MKLKTYLFILLSLPFFQTDLFAQEFGLQLYSLRNQFKNDIEKSLKTIADWGIHTIEGGDTYGMEEAEFRSLLEKYELNPVSIGADYDELRKNPEAVAEKAIRYGARFVMCAWIPHDGNRFDIENTKAAVKVFNEAGAVLKKEGITLAYHAHGYEFRPYEYGTLFDYMAQNAKNFSLEMDVFWITHGGEDPIALLEKYPDFVVMLHLKDMEKGVKGNNTGGEDVETNVVLGQGQIDIEGVVKKAHKLGVRYMFIEDESSRVEQQVPQSLKFLKSISVN